MDDAPLLDAKEILSVLVRHQVRFVVIGALAATIQGFPLRTEDLDILPDRAPQNLERLAEALVELGSTEWDPHKGEFVERRFTGKMLASDSLWMLGTRYGRLDLVFEPAGANGYKDLARRARIYELEPGIQVEVAALEDVIRSKEIAHRDKDRAQLGVLRKLLTEIERRRSKD